MAQDADPSQSDISSKQIPKSEPAGGDPRWHKISSLADGTPIGRLGAYWYILNEDGYAISDGYHEIYLDENGDYKGKRSARSEGVELYTESSQA